MLPPVPSLDDYGISEYGFLPDTFPLEILPDPYYRRWEAIASNLQALLLSKRLRHVVDDLDIITASRLRSPGEWRRAYVLLSFMTHAYIWGGDKPAEVRRTPLLSPTHCVCWWLRTIPLQRVPPSLSIPFIQVCRYLELPTVATYAGVCLWNFKPIFSDEPIDTLDNLSTLATFTGSLDESWFYLVSVAIEARGGPTIPLMLEAIEAARANDSRTVTECLHAFAERLDELGTLLTKMYENCDPHVFYHRIRPFLAGSKNMADAGLPNGVVFDTGAGDEHYSQYGGGSNAQSSLIQFFDIVLGVEHRPTGIQKSSDSSTESDTEAPSAPPSRHNFIHEMRSYMPGPHRRFLEHVSSVANIRDYVEAHVSNRPLSIAYDACLAMVRALRDKHIQMVSRYIIVKSRESRSHSRSLSPRNAPNQPQPLNLANTHRFSKDEKPGSKRLRGTGGTSLIPFLKQARDETGEPAIDAWARRILSNRPTESKTESPFASWGKTGELADGEVEIVGLAGVWKMDDTEGGLCHW